MFVRIGMAVCLIIVNVVKTEDEAKWVWKTKGAETQQSSLNNKAINPNSRYEVFEADHYESNGYRPDFIRPDRPVGIHQEDGFPNRPFLNRPGVDEFIINERPYNDLPSGGNRPQHGILTGPVPSWLRDPPFRHFDTCKCAEKFNCNSPGVSYGQCDVGKQYCCYARKGNAYGGAAPHRPVYSPDNGVLVGPGGPINRPFRPNRPYPQHVYDQEISLGRPPRPHHVEIEHTPELGILVGPGGPHNQRPPYHFGYDRQAKSESEKN